MADQCESDRNAATKLVGELSDAVVEMNTSAHRPCLADCLGDLHLDMKAGKHDVVIDRVVALLAEFKSGQAVDA